jgi:hypothetical protein
MTPVAAAGIEYVLSGLSLAVARGDDPIQRGVGSLTRAFLSPSRASGKTKDQDSY